MRRSAEFVEGGSKFFDGRGVDMTSASAWRVVFWAFSSLSTCEILASLDLCARRKELALATSAVFPLFLSVRSMPIEGFAAARHRSTSVLSSMSLGAAEGKLRLFRSFRLVLDGPREIISAEALAASLGKDEERFFI